MARVKFFFFPIKTLKGRPAPRLLLEKRALAPPLVTKGCQSQGLRWSPHGEAAGGEGTGLPPAAVSEAAGGSEQKCEVQSGTELERPPGPAQRGHCTAYQESGPPSCGP